jgi:hypothetical protein
MIRIFMTVMLVIAYTLSNAQNNLKAHRKGFVFGTALGLANSQMRFPSKNQNYTNLAINWKIGYMLNPKLAILINGSVSIYDYDLTDRPRKRDFGGVFPSVQYHITDKIWLLGGVGIGTDAPVFYDLKPENEIETKYYSGIGGISSVGYEIYKRKKLVIDLQANGFNSAILLGINFY